MENMEKIISIILPTTSSENIEKLKIIKSFGIKNWRN